MTADQSLPAMPKIGRVSSCVLPAVSLWRRELVRFARQPSRWVGAMGTPLVFWLLVGSGLGDSFRPGGAAPAINYLEYSFPGMLVLVVLFTSVFANISLIEDRQTGFLQAVVASPVDRSAIVLGKILGSSTVAMMQAMLLLVIAPLVGLPLTLGSVAAAFGVLVLLSLGLSALGFLFAWHIESTAGFHGIMNLVLLPMWLVSGALFPAEGASTWLGWLMAINPVTYGVAALRHALYMGIEGTGGSIPGLGLCVLVSVGFTGTIMALAARAVAGKN